MFPPERAQFSRTTERHVSLVLSVGGGLLLTHSHAAFQLKTSFLVQVTHTTIGAFAAPAVTLAMAESGCLTLVLPGQEVMLRPRPAALSGVRDLDSSRLDVALASLPAHQLSFQHGVDNVRATVASGSAQAGVLLRPATVAQIEATTPTEPAASLGRSARKNPEGFRTSRNPRSPISKTPISLVDPKRFLTALSTRYE